MVIDFDKQFVTITLRREVVDELLKVVNNTTLSLKKIHEYRDPDSRTHEPQQQLDFAEAYACYDYWAIRALKLIFVNMLEPLYSDKKK